MKILAEYDPQLNRPSPANAEDGLVYHSFYMDDQDVSINGLNDAWRQARIHAKVGERLLGVYAEIEYSPSVDEALDTLWMQLDQAEDAEEYEKAYHVIEAALRAQGLTRTHTTDARRERFAQ